MGPGEGPVPAAASGAADPDGAARQRAGRDKPPGSWLDDEPALGAAGWSTVRRLGRRAYASWPLWLAAALLVSGGLAFRRARAPVRYEATTVLRVSEGTITIKGSELSGGALRSHMSDLAFTSEHLLAVMRRHPQWFGGLNADPVSALAGFRDATEVTILHNGFIEDRGPGDPPRAAWVVVTYHAPTPDAAWTITTELGELLAGSTLAGQRVALEREEAAAKESLRQAQADLARLVRDDPTRNDERVRAARERWRMAQTAVASTGMAVHAASARQALRFEIVDPGRRPEVQSKLAGVLPRFLGALFVAVAVGWLLVGAFDPRVLEAGDVAMTGLGVLGELPMLPLHLPAGEGGSRRPRV
jgi:hypothetical protein